MKNTGIVRRVDDLGRIVIPKELRRELDIEEGDPIEIFTDNDTIILRQYNPGCLFCRESNNIIEFKGKRVCESCLKELMNGGRK